MPIFILVNLQIFQRAFFNYLFIIFIKLVFEMLMIELQTIPSDLFPQ